MWMDDFDGIREFVCGEFLDPNVPIETPPLDEAELQKIEELMRAAKPVQFMAHPISPAELEDLDVLLTMCVDCNIKDRTRQDCINCLRASGKGKGLLRELEEKPMLD